MLAMNNEEKNSQHKKLKMMGKSTQMKKMQTNEQTNEIN